MSDISIEKLKSVLDLCKGAGVSRFKYGEIEMVFAPTIIPSEIPIVSKEKFQTNSPEEADVDMPDDLLGWSSPLEIQKESKK